LNVDGTLADTEEAHRQAFNATFKEFGLAWYWDVERYVELLAVSKRTVDNWIADGTIIAPSAIGRRVYWHPDAFFRWLDEKLGADCSRPPVLARPPKRGRPRVAYPGQRCSG
jgi:phosphoglycolate phosphatase-like HAD superfamily hydrolase